MKKTVIVVSAKGLTQEQIQMEFSRFFSELVDKYPNKFSCGLSVMTEYGAQKVLDIAHLK